MNYNKKKNLINGVRKVGVNHLGQSKERMNDKAVITF